MATNYDLLRARLESEHKRLTQELEQLKAEGIFKDAERVEGARKVEGSYQELKNMVSQLTNLLNKKELQISLKEKELSSKDEEISALRENLENLGRENESLLAFLKDKEQSIADLSQALTQMEEQVNFLQEAVFLTKERQNKVESEFHPAVNPEKKKAEDLRRKVKVILDSGM